ncbi:hypothetical protein [Sessilibacter corallicola]|uniref:hypothetical protein n=1 Tax=Sessilibacter corallicola TaxID=2904075 RepID=UPI001E2C4D88|nr:hypothetical protein [Sessilibacter corallicola]MCE2028691.1 hypothetical protein [Sessilibacter corallicola]
MDSFAGLFKFDVDDGTQISWESLDSKIKEELVLDGKIDENNSKVYMFSITVGSCEQKLEKHHDWSKVTRLFIEVKVGHKSMRIGGISPRNKKSKHAPQHEFPFDAKAGVGVDFFSMARFKLSISNFVKKTQLKTR